jgi:hypothetical protein
MYMNLAAGRRRRAAGGAGGAPPTNIVPPLLALVDQNGSDALQYTPGVWPPGAEVTASLWINGVFERVQGTGGTTTNLVLPEWRGYPAEVREVATNPSSGAVTNLTSNVVSVPFIPGVSNLLVGTQGGVYGFTDGAFGGLAPANLEGYVVASLTVDAGNVTTLRLNGGVQALNVNRVAVDFGNGVWQLDWNSGSGAYVGPATGSYAFLQAALGTTIPITLVMSPVNVTAPTLTLVDITTANYGRGTWAHGPTTYLAELWTDDGAGNQAQVAAAVPPGDIAIQPEWLGLSLVLYELGRNDAGNGSEGFVESNLLQMPTAEEVMIDFLAGTPGFYLKPDDPTTLFQDSAGTVPVTANGQPVGRINGAGGTTTPVFSMGTVAQQPTYAAPGRILGDGVDDLLGGPTPWAFNNMPCCFLCFNAEVVSLPVTGDAFWGFANNQTVFVQLNLDSAGSLLLLVQNVTSPPVTAAIMLPGVRKTITVLCDWTGEGRYEVFVDGVSVTSIVPGPVAAPVHSNINRHRLLSNIANTLQPVNAKIGRFVLSNVRPNPFEQAALEAWVSDGPFDPSPPAPPRSEQRWVEPTDFTSISKVDGLVTHNGRTWRNIAATGNLGEPGIFYGWEAVT